MCVCLSLPPALSRLSLSCVSLWNSNSKPLYFSIALAHHTWALSLNLSVSLPALLCIADVVPLLVLTSENPRKNLAIIQWCSQLKREWLNPVFCVHLRWNAAPVSAAEHHVPPHVSLVQDRIKTMSSQEYVSLTHACTVTAPYWNYTFTKLWYFWCKVYRQNAVPTWSNTFIVLFASVLHMPFLKVFL